MVKVRSSHRRCSMKKTFIKNFAMFIGKHPCWSLFLIRFIKKETLTQVLSCKYGVTLKAPVLKNFCQRLLLNGRHWYSTNEILKFSYWDKFLHFLSADFLLGFFFKTIYFFWVLGQLPPRKITPNPKTNPKPNPNPNQRAIFLGGNSLGVPQP